MAHSFFKYNQLDDSGKSTFLQIVTNTILVVLTFWLGLSLQFMTADSQQKNTKILTQKDYLDKLLPYKQNIDRFMNLEGFQQKMVELGLDWNNSNDTKFKADNFLSQFCNDTTRFERAILDVDSLIDTYVYLKYLIPEEEKDNFQDNLTNAYDLTIIIRMLSDQNFDWKKERTSYKYAYITGGYNSSNLDASVKEYKIGSDAEMIRAAFLKTYMHLMNLYISFDSLLLSPTNDSFWDSKAFKISIGLLIFSFIIAVFVTRFVINKALEKKNSVSNSVYRELEAQKNHLEIEVEQSKVSLKTLNSINEGIQNKYDDLYKHYLNALEDIKELRNKKK